MHEFSIAQSLLDIALEQCLQSGFTRIDYIKVLVGRAAGVMPDSLCFSFDALKEGTIAGQALLEIQEVPVSGQCNTCSLHFASDEPYLLGCPGCGSYDYTLCKGRELMIEEMEVN